MVIGKCFIFAKNYLWMVGRNRSANTAHFNFLWRTLRTNPVWRKKNMRITITTRSVCGKPQGKCHRCWLRLRHAVILILNDRTSASEKIKRMALIQTLTVSTTAFERTKEKFDGFRQIAFSELNVCLARLQWNFAGPQIILGSLKMFWLRMESIADED